MICTFHRLNAPKMRILTYLKTKNSKAVQRKMHLLLLNYLHYTYLRKLLHNQPIINRLPVLLNTFIDFFYHMIEKFSILNMVGAYNPSVVFIDS